MTVESARVDVDLELHLYSRVRQMYTDLLRAKKKDVADDSENSSSGSDNDEDQVDKVARRDKRKEKRFQTARRVRQLRIKGDLPEKCHDVDSIQAWMDDQGHILTVSTISLPPNTSDIAPAPQHSMDRWRLIVNRNSSGSKSYRKGRGVSSSKRVGTSNDDTRPTKKKDQGLK